MDALAQVLAANGHASVRTYIQTGNIEFRHPGSDASDLSARITKAIADQFGLQPTTIVFPHSRLRRAILGMLFSDLEDRNSVETLHIFFLASAPESPDLERLYQLRAAHERFHHGHEVACLHAPSGFGRSRLAGAVERVLGVSVTARNWRTVTALDALATADE